MAVQQINHPQGGHGRLTKENCFVFTGDLGAVPGGVIDPITNPMGLRSNWCGPAFVGTLSWEFSPVK